MFSGLFSGLLSGSFGVADTPSHIKVNLFRWLSFRPWLAFTWIGMLIASILLSFVSTLGGAMIGVLLLVAASYWFRVWKFYWHGGLIPAVVVSEEPPLVAAYSNLSQVSEFLPHVKVQQVQLMGAPKLGQRVVALAWFTMPVSGRTWVDFRAFPLNQATANAEIHAAAEAKLGEDSYQRSAEHLKAQMDFDEVIRLRPDFGPAYRMRAFSMRAQKLQERFEADQAEADRLAAPKTITEPFSYRF